MADRIAAPDRPRRPGRRPGGGRHRDLLLDQQLPGGPARGQPRQLPDQAGRRRPQAQSSPAHHLRHPLADPGLRRLAARGALGSERRPVRPGRSSTAAARGPGPPGLARGSRGRRARSAAAVAAVRPLSGAREARRPPARPGRPVPPRQRRPAGAGQLAGRHFGEGPAPNPSGLLVNYKYDTTMIERNHELYTNNGEVILSAVVRAMLPASS